MTYDVLAEHASREERRELIRRHRGALLAMGVVTGYLGAAPSLVWASGALGARPRSGVGAAWPCGIYTLVFAFSALLVRALRAGALQALRRERTATGDAAAAPAAVALRAIRTVAQRGCGHAVAGAVRPRRGRWRRHHPCSRADLMNFGVIIIGDEILSGKRVDKHLPKTIELLGARGLSLRWARYLGDEPARIHRGAARRPLTAATRCSPAEASVPLPTTHAPVRRARAGRAAGAASAGRES